jgi:hypothetical protein
MNAFIGPTDALVAVTRACICGSDLWPYRTLEHTDVGRRMGHEAIGVVEAVGAGVRTMKVGDVVVMPFAYSDGTCVFCHEGLHTWCIHGGFFGTGVVDGAQAEAVRAPQADGTLFALPVGKDDALMPSLLTLSDVMGTGHHAAVAAKVGPGKTAVVVGDGAVGLATGRSPAGLRGPASRLRPVEAARPSRAPPIPSQRDRGSRVERQESPSCAPRPRGKKGWSDESGLCSASPGCASYPTCEWGCRWSRWGSP